MTSTLFIDSILLHIKIQTSQLMNEDYFHVSLVISKIYSNCTPFKNRNLHPRRHQKKRRRRQKTDLIAFFFEISSNAMFLFNF